MVVEEEYERTFLAKYIPEGIEKCNFIDIADNFIPKESNHPILRIRKNGDKFVIYRLYDSRC